MLKVLAVIPIVALLACPSFSMGQKYEDTPDEEEASIEAQQLPGVPREEAPAQESAAADECSDESSEVEAGGESAAVSADTKKKEPAPSYKAESFIAPVDWEADGFVTGEKDKKLLISAGDTVYVNLGSDKVKSGTACMVYRIVGKMKDRETRELIGYEMRRIARIVITSSVGEKTSTAKVTVSYEPVEIGDVVTVLKKDE